MPEKQQESDFPKLSQPAHRALAGAGYSRLEQLTKVTEAEILALHGVGPTTIVALNQALAARGLKFAEAKQRQGRNIEPLPER